MSREFDDHLKATLERELSRAYLADDDPRLARYKALAASRAVVGGAGSWLSAAAPAVRLRLAALVIVGSVVVSGAAVVEASRSSQGLILPLLQPASGQNLADGQPSGAKDNPTIESSSAAATTPRDDHETGSALAGAVTGKHDPGDQEAPALSDPSPTPEHDSGAPSGAGREPEPVLKPGCPPQSPTSSRSSPEAPPEAPTDGHPTDPAVPEAGQPTPHDPCG